MGSCFSVSLSLDNMVEQVSQWLCLKGSYVHNLPENLSSLEDAMKVFKGKRDDVQSRVDREEFTGTRRRLAQVEVWLNSVLNIENQVSDLLINDKIELQRLCLCSFCSKNLRQSYRYGENVIMMLKEIESLSSEGEFDVVTEAAPVAQAEEMPIHPTIVGQETLLERVWNHLMADDVLILGLYGMGGVGKTTLLTQINNKFAELGGRFNIVIWVVVSNGATSYTVQEEIAQKLGFKGEEWERTKENARAVDIHNVLKRKKFVLLLDDIWKKVDLKAVGIPNPSKENGCKVVFTTRSKDVCGHMGVHDPIKVNCLSPNKAWELFQKKVGANTLESHPDIPELARKLCNKCQGLPLALDVIGETMTCKTSLEEWRHAIDVMTSSSAEFSGMENEILPILKYSYDRLGDQVKSCFLYCSLFCEDSQIEKQSLIEYWIYEGFIDEKKGREKALNQGYEIIGTLVRASLLLEETRYQLTVGIHDVIREMALWIANDCGKYKDKYIVQAGVGLSQTPKINDWRVVQRMSLMKNEIESIIDNPECPQLTTLFLQRNNKLVNISKEFFQSMPKLLVLDLSYNGSLDELPEEISKLGLLRYLNLSSTNINGLPLGLQALKMLKHLDVEGTKRLESLNGISNLSSLKIIQFRFSNITLDTSLMKELEVLEHLESININISIREQWFYDSKVATCVHELRIIEVPDESVRMLVLPTLVNLHGVFISKCEMFEINIKKTKWNTSLKTPCFQNLSSVYVIECNYVKDLTCLIFAPNLTTLHVSDSNHIEAIINKRKAASLLKEEGEEDEGSVIPFRKLKVLYLSNLRSLMSIYWSSLPFPCLLELQVKMCPVLFKLPLDSQSVHKIEDFVLIYHGFDDLIDRITWKDNATRRRFSPYVRENGA